MKRVYLDQNKWIDVARVDKGATAGKPFENAVALLNAGVELGELSVPLSRAHFIETNNRRDWDSRRELAETMFRLSRRHTVAPADAVLPGELDRALKEFFGRPRELRQVKPFGVGPSHAFNQDVHRYRIPDELRPLVPDPWTFERGANEALEMVLLGGVSPEQEAQLHDYEPLGHLKVAESYAEEKEALRETRVKAGWHKGERLASVTAAEAFTDHIEPISEALGRAWVSGDALLQLGPEGMTRFRDVVPTMFASSELERLRHSASQKRWERQDLTDITALAVAGVYCDIVVTERLWVDVARRARFQEKFGTVFLPSLEQLPEHLV